MAVKANKQFWTEFIDTYHSLPSLWNTKDENYNNRESRSMAWNKLVNKLREFEPDVNQGSVKRKINTFRSNFNREVRKIRQTQREQGAELYNPTLWYFDHLSFLLNYEDVNTLMGHITTECEIQHNDTTSESFDDKEDFTNSSNNDYKQTVINKLIPSAENKNKPKRTSIENQEGTHLEYATLTNVENVSNADTSINSPLPSSIDIKISNPPRNEEFKNQPNRKVVRNSLKKKSILLFNPNKPYVRNNHNDKIKSIDEADIYGQSWACGFRKLTPEQKLYAKKAIDEILLLGQLNLLKLHTVPMNAS